jgi:hypothetical protein
VPAPTYGSIFEGASCTAPGNCTAVGFDNGDPVVATEIAGSWGTGFQVATPSAGGQFDGVSCTASGECTAVGFDNGGAVVATFAY